MPPKAKILVVDDDPVIVKATRRLLDKAGYETLPAQTGREALEAARAHHPDLILLDVNMPDMNGFDACRQLKADPALAGIGVIIVTSTYTDAESQASGLDLGADGYIARPISNRELLARLQAMLRQRDAEQEARRVAAEWAATFDAVESAIFLTDEHFTILKCNRKAEALFQTPQAEIVGQKCYRLVHGTHQHFETCPLAAVREDKQRKMLVFEHEGRWLEVTVDPVLDENGDFIGSVHVVNDITERKRIEDEIRRLNAELEARVEERTRQLREAQEQLVRQERLAVLGQLAGSVGHELRNPLAVISNAVYFLKLTQPEADEKVREYLDILERETRNADKIINDLLDFARIKSVERAAVPVPDLVRRVLERYPAPANIRLRLDLPPGLPPLYVDGRQIEQVLGNLVLNAYQAMEAEGGELAVISEQLSVNSEQWLRITVKDTGPGIPPENLPKLFEPLFTTKARGIGLGLAVSKRLAEANGGRIEVQSTPRQGAAFTLILPAVPQPPQALQTEAEQ